MFWLWFKYAKLKNQMPFNQTKCVLINFIDIDFVAYHVWFGTI